MQVIALVAGAVFKESVRDRVPLAILGFAIILISASYLISQLTAGQDLKIIKDLGLAALSVLGVLIAVFIGIGLVSKEVERRSIYGLLTKPVSREAFLLGKYLGLVMTLLVNLAAMTVAYYLVLGYMDWTATESMRKAWTRPPLDPGLLAAVGLTMMELALVTALALFFSTFSSPLLSAMLTFGLWVAGRFNADLRQFENVVEAPALVYLMRGFYYTLPNLAPFNVRAEAVHGVPVPWSHVLLTSGYALVYIALMLSAATVVFRSRDFK